MNYFSFIGIFSLSAPLWAVVDRAMSYALPPWSRLAVWGVLAGSVSMLIYWQLSPREKIARVRTELQAAQRSMLAYDGDFAGLLQAVRHSIGLSLLQLFLAIGPALGASLPGLCLIPFLESSYSYGSAGSGAMVATPGGWELIFFGFAAIAAMSQRELLHFK